VERITEQDSPYRHLDQLSIHELLRIINAEDKTVPYAVERAIPQIERLCHAALELMEQGGRLFYIGSGTSGRLGIVDASECPPTYGVPEGLVVGIIAGGDRAIRKAVEGAEDDPDQGWRDLETHQVSPMDFVIGISASGTTPYTVGAIQQARKRGIKTGCITCNPNTPLAQAADFPVEVIVGPEVVTGSTRMKAGTAQKLVLNMISTTLMIKLGHVLDNKMVDMQLANQKLWDRAIRYFMRFTGADKDTAQRFLKEAGSLRKALKRYKQEPNAL